MSRRMFRYAVPLDDEAHEFRLTHDPCAVAAMRYCVEFWAPHDDDAPEFKRAFRVYGTGHPVPPAARWIGTAPRTPEGFVWHLFEEQP